MWDVFQRAIEHGVQERTEKKGHLFAEYIVEVTVRVFVRARSP
jgi:hypothetical protein